MNIKNYALIIIIGHGFIALAADKCPPCPRMTPSLAQAINKAGACAQTYYKSSQVLCRYPQISCKALSAIYPLLPTNTTVDKTVKANVADYLRTTCGLRPAQLGKAGIATKGQQQRIKRLQQQLTRLRKQIRALQGKKIVGPEKEQLAKVQAQLSALQTLYGKQKADLDAVLKDREHLEAQLKTILANLQEVTGHHQQCSQTVNDIHDQLNAVLKDLDDSRIEAQQNAQKAAKTQKDIDTLKDALHTYLLKQKELISAHDDYYAHLQAGAEIEPDVLKQESAVIKAAFDAFKSAVDTLNNALASVGLSDVQFSVSDIESLAFEAPIELWQGESEPAQPE